MSTPSNAQAPLNLRFEFDAILGLEEQGMNLMDGGLKEEDMKKAKSYVTLAWAGFLHENPDLTVEEARKKLRGYTTKQVVEAITTALIRDLGKNEEKSQVEGTPASS